MDHQHKGSDREKILPENSAVEVKVKEKKKKRVKKVNSNGHLTNLNAYDGATRQMASQSDTQVPLRPMVSREGWINIHEQLTSDPSTMPQIDRNEKDARKLALHLAINKSTEGKNSKFSHFDYVLAHKTGDNLNVHERLREKYESELHEQGFRVERKHTTQRTFAVLQCSFERLCEEAEHVSLEMPLAGVSQLMMKEFLMFTGERVKRL